MWSDYVITVDDSVHLVDCLLNSVEVLSDVVVLVFVTLCTGSSESHLDHAHAVH